MSTEPKKFKLGYWKMKGLAHVPRMMFAARGVEYDNEMYACVKREDGSWDRSAWSRDAYPTLCAEKTPFCNLPYLELPDGSFMVQSNAILRHLARVLDLYGSTDEERRLIDEIHENMIDLRNTCVRSAYGSYEADRESLAKDVLPYYIGGLEQTYLKGDGDHFLVGGRLSFADLYVYDVCVIIHAMCDNALVDKYPKVQKFVAKIRALPELAEFFSSPLATLPFNNPSAKFAGEHQPSPAG